MKCIIKRSTNIEKINRLAIVGKQDNNRSIYLSFLRHIAETPNPSYRTINTIILNNPETSQRGKRIVEMLMSDRLVKINIFSDDGDIISLTDVGSTALENKIMIEPSEGDYSFFVINDTLYPQMIIDYGINTEKTYSKGKQNPKRRNGFGISWLKAPEFPVSSNGGKQDNNDPKKYFLPGKRNEVLYLYSINEEGEEPVKTNDYADIIVKLESKTATNVEIVTKNGKVTIENSPGSELTCESVVEGINNLPENLRYIHDIDDIVSISGYEELSEEMKERGTVSCNLSNIKIPGYGVFNECNICDIKVMVNSKESLLYWSFHRILDKINHYITPDEYERLQESEAKWCSEHAISSLNMDASMIKTGLPAYSMLIRLLQDNVYGKVTDTLLLRYADELKKMVEKKPALRWYLIAPSLLSLPREMI